MPVQRKETMTSCRLIEPHPDAMRVWGLLGEPSMRATSISLMIATFLCGVGHGSEASAGTTQPARIDVVAVVGCITQERTRTLLTDASGPIEIPDVDGRAVTVQMVIDRPAGSQNYHLIGNTVLEEFNISSHDGHWGLVKGLPISDDGATRLNVVSFEMVADVCK